MDKLLLGLFCGLIAVTVIGHGIWVAIAALVRAMFHAPTPQPIHEPLPVPRRRREPRGNPLDDLLNELEITVRQINALRDRGDLDADTAVTVHRLLARRRRELVSEPSAPAEPAPLARPMFGGATEPNQLSPDERRQALAWYRQLDDDELAGLSVPVHRLLARVLRMAGLASRALAAYRLLLDAHPRSAERGAIALEAAAFAVQEKQTAVARRFLVLAADADLSDEARAELDVLRGQLEQPAELAPAPPSPVRLAPASDEPILDVIPIDRPAPAPSVEVQDALPVREREPGFTPRAEAPPPPPKRSWTDVLAGFMEDRNILWGELVGGLLIVGCSIALVLTLWRSLEDLPYFPFLIFSGITLALFGAGQYTLHHWKLEATSRGLLVIAALLAPLNLLVLASTPSLGGWLDYAVPVAALLVFLGVLRASGRDLIGTDVLSGPLDRRWLLSLAVVGAAGSQLLAPHLIEKDVAPPDWVFVLLSSLPVACQALALGAVLGGLVLYGRRDAKPLDEKQASALFVFAGLATFALLAALGFLLTRGNDLPFLLKMIAFPLAVGGLPVLGVGLLVYHRLEGAEASGWRTAGTAVALSGLAVMLAGVVLAWPAPGPLLLGCLFNGIVLTVLAFTVRTPWAHYGAMPCLALASVLGYHLLLGHLPAPPDVSPGPWLAQQLLSGASGAVLAAVALALIALAEVLVRAGRRPHAEAYAASAAAAAVVALFLATLNSVGQPYVAASVYGLLAVGGLAANVRWRYRALTWIGSALGLMALVQYLAFSPVRDVVPLPLSAALLLHAALALLGAVVARREDDESLFARPFFLSVQISSILAVPLLFLPGLDLAAVRAGQTAVLALLWLTLAWAHRSPVWFAAFQAALSVSALFAVTVWIERQPWFLASDFRLLDVRALQAYGVGLAALGLAWALGRRALSGVERVRERWRSPCPLDRLVLGALVVAQLMLVAGATLPDVVRELVPRAERLAEDFPGSVGAAFGPSAWLLLSVLAAALLATFAGAEEKGVRQRTVLALLVLVLAVPIVWAGQHALDLAVASALRWGLAATFVVCSALVWWREPLARLGAMAHFPPRPSPTFGATAVTVVEGREQEEAFTTEGPSHLTAVPAVAQGPGGLPLDALVRGLLLGPVAVVLLLTAIVASIGFSGSVPAGPLPESPFAQLGWALSNVGPLALLALGLVGTAVRERSPGYAFAAGLVANATVVGGYALTVVTGGGALDVVESVRLGQLAGLTAALWAVGWAIASRQGAPPLLLAQIGLGLAANVLLFLLALLSPPNFFLLRDQWASEVGSPLGWLALLAALAALALGRWRQRARLEWRFPFYAGAALPILLACSVERLAPGAGHQALLLATTGYGLLWAIALLWGPRLLADLEDLPAGIAVCHALPVLAGIAAIAQLNERLWPAAALALMSATWGVLAGALRRDELALGAGALLNAAVLLVAWHVYGAQHLELWWPALVVFSAGTTAAVALLWLALLPAEERPAPLLALQALFGLGLLAALALAPLTVLFASPQFPLGAPFTTLGWGSWLALALALTAALWYARERAPAWRIHAFAAAALTAGAFAACFAAPWDEVGRWLSFHVLAASWGGLALAVVVGGSLLKGESALFPAFSVRRWSEGLALALVLLALRADWGGPARPVVPALLTGAACALMVAVALWYRRELHVYASGAIFWLLGVLLWSAWGETTATSFAFTSALCLALASAGWTVVALMREEEGRPLFPFAHFAALAGLGLFLFVVALVVGHDLARLELLAGRASWGAALALALCLGVALGDRRAWFAQPGLYAFGLGLLGLALHDFTRGPEQLAWWATIALALYVPLTAALCFRARLLDRTAAWFLPAQGLVLYAVLALSIWACLSFAGLGERLAGPFAVLALLLGTLVMAAGTAELSIWRRGLLHVVLVLGAVVLAEVGWALPSPEGPAPWPQRNVLLLAALVATMFLYHNGLARWSALSNSWREAAGSLSAALGGLAVLVLLLVLSQELLLYNKDTLRGPLEPASIVLVVLAVAALMFAALRFAVVPGGDPLGMPEGGRTLYVYLAEVLLVLLFVHLRLSVPELFPRGFAAQYWTMILMLVAFLGVGLAELFERRGLRVLATPLQRTGVFLPLIPLLAIWARPPDAFLQVAGEAAPGTTPMLGYLQNVPWRFDRYAVLWLMASALYALVALSRRSSLWALVAALAANFGVWSLLAHHGIAFLMHPQAWLIPLALIVLVSEHINREKLPEGVSTSLRYLGVCMIYVASTADLFLAGIGASLWLPIVLAVLAVGGVLAGILLRVKAFLFLGVSFLMLDLFTMIWHAAVNRSQTWLWWASGIVLGVAILTLFAVFEKRRNDVLKLIEQIKRWD